MQTPALETIERALADVDNLITHHPKATQPGPGHPGSDEGPLLRSCILLTYAAWEVYAEDSALWATEEVVKRATTHDQLPNSLRTFVASRSPAKSDPWSLAGEDWRQTVVDTVRDRIYGTGGGSPFGINTAGPNQVKKLHQELFGDHLILKCRWSKASNADVLRRLADLVSIRGTVAHTGRTDGSLSLDNVRKWRTFAKRLAEHLDRHLVKWVDSQGIVP
ncbi:HEPN domain-containing protein [Rhodococcus sp. 11-3]|uniref:HEPN domain-containing protein n=1 Tax=Rhodococcus sp. 11-3 TaxID=2854796 RepID=UPI0021855D0C|nr:hypothetical protein KZJ41_04700 [Rhodococcus sp. 11-3]